MIRRPPRSTRVRSSAASDVYKRQEARLTYALGLDLPLPAPEELGVWVGSYLHGLGEAVGELRRRLLDLLRAGELDRAEATLKAMDDCLLYTSPSPRDRTRS